MANRLVIVGMGGFGREVHDLVDDINRSATDHRNRFDVIGFLDDADPDASLASGRELPHLGGVGRMFDLAPDVQYVVAIGSGSVRRRIDQMYERAGRAPATLVHPSAVVGSRRVTIGAGGIICSMVSMTTNVTLGRHVHLNMGVTVGHDVVCESYVTVSPNASISGNVVLEEEAFIGTGASVIPHRRIGARAAVGAGSAVMHDIGADLTAVGVPARPLPRRATAPGPGDAPM
jgi:sugar O-acyltransferase (sialic acid O-acetyltransferase NeuD family)